MRGNQQNGLSGYQGNKPHKKHVGAALSLNKFANAGVSKYDKRKVIEKQKKAKLIKYSKYAKLKHRLKAEGVLTPVEVKDKVAELEELEQGPTGSRDDAQPQQPPHKRQKKHAHNAQPESEGGQQPEAPEQPDSQAGPSGSHPHHQQPHLKRAAHQQPQQQSSQQQQQQHAKLHGQHQNQNQDHDQPGLPGPPEDNASQGHGRPRGKPLSRLERLAQEVAAQKAEAMRVREEARKLREERMQKVAAVEKARREEKSKFFKKTSRGQPVMKYRIDKILDKLQHGA